MGLCKYLREQIDNGCELPYERYGVVIQALLRLDYIGKMLNLGLGQTRADADMLTAANCTWLSSTKTKLSNLPSSTSLAVLINPLGAAKILDYANLCHLSDEAQV
jgi:hypothetical protein